MPNYAFLIIFASSLHKTINMKRFFLYFALLLLSGLNAFADDIQFTASAPNAVVNGRRFNLVFSLKNAQPENLQIPDLSNFEVIMGPSVSQGSEFRIINGTTTKSENVSYTYILQPKKEGTFTISPAKITVNGKTVMTNALTIKVLPEDQAGNVAANGSSNGDATVSISNDDIFVKTEFSKRKVFEQEHIIATTKLYYRVNVRGLEDIKFPEYKGFTVQDITLSEDKKYGMENVNGKNYKTATLKQSILFPQRTGTLDIESGKVNTIIQVQVGNQRGSRNIFDDFFGSYKDVRKIISIPGAKIEVTPLPNKPANFNNAVGTFQMQSSINSENVKANEAINIKIKITGNGNVKYIKNPDIKFPNDFEVYEPKVDTKINATASGVSGTKEIEYLAIPRFAGDFTIPAAQFIYFDTNTKQYKTLSTPEYHLKVEKGDASSISPQVVNYTNKEDVKFFGKDIRFIDTKNLKVKDKDDYIYGSTTFWLSYIIPLFLFFALFVLYRKQAKENANIALMKNKRANKQAKKRLKTAEAHLKEDNKAAFYEEILKALWGYTSDKLNIPVAELTKDNIESELALHKVSQDTINEFMQILHTYEFARFAPAESVGTMDDSYEKAIELIGKLEEEVRK